MIDYIAIYNFFRKKFPFLPEEKKEPKKRREFLGSKLTDEQCEAAITAALEQQNKNFNDGLDKAIGYWISKPMNYREIVEKLIKIDRLPIDSKSYFKKDNNDDRLHCHL